MKKTRRAMKKRAPDAVGARTLAVDVGGTGIKAIVLDEKGGALTERDRVATPKQASPKAVLRIIRKLAAAEGKFDRVSVGFPGVIKDGVVYSAPNLGKGWNGVDLARELKGRLDRPVRVANDADVQGLGCVRRRGLELVITLGTGFGSVLFTDGQGIHLELAHHPFHKGKTYEDELGHRALEKKGKRRWNKLLREAIADLKRAFNYDRLYIGGGNSKFVSLKLPPNVKIVSNAQGLLGGIALWRDHTGASPHATSRARVSPHPAGNKTTAPPKASAGIRRPKAPRMAMASSLPVAPKAITRPASDQAALAKPAAAGLARPAAIQIAPAAASAAIDKAAPPAFDKVEPASRSQTESMARAKSVHVAKPGGRATIA
jgi:polyphosphate glucokinase